MARTEPKKVECAMGAAEMDLERWSRLAPMNPHWVLLVTFTTHAGQVASITTERDKYSSKKHGNSRKNSKHKEQRDDLRAALRVCLEDMINVLQLPVSERLLAARCWRCWVQSHIEVENMCAQW